MHAAKTLDLPKFYADNKNLPMQVRMESLERGLDAERGRRKDEYKEIKQRLDNIMLMLDGRSDLFYELGPNGEKKRLVKVTFKSDPLPDQAEE